MNGGPEGTEGVRSAERRVVVLLGMGHCGEMASSALEVLNL